MFGIVWREGAGKFRGRSESGERFEGKRSEGESRRKEHSWKECRKRKKKGGAVVWTRARVKGKEEERELAGVKEEESRVGEQRFMWGEGNSQAYYRWGSPGRAQP